MSTLMWTVSELEDPQPIFVNLADMKQAQYSLPDPRVYARVCVCMCACVDVHYAWSPWGPLPQTYCSAPPAENTLILLLRALQPALFFRLALIL